MTEPTPATVRKRLKEVLPGVRFTIRTVSFQDLARKDAIVVTCDDWTPERYRTAKQVTNDMPGVIVSG